MNKNFKIAMFILMGAILAPASISSQATDNKKSLSIVTIEDCYQWTKENYPLVKQLGLIDKASDYNVKNAMHGYLPRVSINGQATYQSSVTELPINIPNIDIPTVNKDQYKAYAEVYQSLTSFSQINNGIKQLKTKAQIEKQQVEVTIYKLNDRINQLYFGSLLIDAKNEQLSIIISDIEKALELIHSAIQNGTATIMDQQLLQVEKLAVEQKIEENLLNNYTFRNMLSLITGKQITDKTQLKKPVTKSTVYQINRPEMHLFELQNEAINWQYKNLKNLFIPNLGLFGQAGYGRPALNFLSNDFEGYFIGGIKLKWNLADLYSYKNKKNNLRLAGGKVDVRKETFLLNMKLDHTQKSNEVNKFEKMILRDTEIVKLRSSVQEIAEVQLKNGLITTVDYLRYLNEVSKAKQMLLLHETQLLLAQYDIKATTGNL